MLLTTLLLAELSLADRPLLASRVPAEALVDAAQEVLAVRASASRVPQGVVEGGGP
ncbi:hypothetical protein ACRAKI_01505 [Saccharothrix isguenensis]